MSAIDSAYARTAYLPRLICGWRPLLAVSATLVVLSLTTAPAFPAEQVSVPALQDSARAGAAVLGKVEKVAVGSRGATITLEGGRQVRLDLSGMGGSAGGTDYLGWGMMLFGLSVVTRLLSTVARIMRPFAPSRRKEEIVYERR